MRKTGLEVWAAKWLVMESPPLSVFGCGGLKLTEKSKNLQGKMERKLPGMFFKIVYKYIYNAMSALNIDLLYRHETMTTIILSK